MPETVNTWSKGLNQDIAKTLSSKDSYLDARNMRLVTNLGQSSYAIENIKGNNLSFSIPDTFPIYKIKFQGTGAVQITIAGQTSNVLTVPQSASGQKIYDLLDSDSNLTNFGITYNVAIGSDYVIVYSQIGDTFTSSSDPSVLIVTTTVSSQSNLIPIGFTTIRDEIYIYSTANTTQNPGGHNPSLSTDPSCPGQIWKLTYNLNTFSPTLTLIYNNLIDFTTYHPIAPTATLGRFENEDIQRIYWTDFFNSLRSLNVADSNAMALDPSILDVSPSVNLDIPILQRVSLGGTLKVGCYQASYRLKNVGGAVTNFSPLSNNVFIVITDETTNTNGSNWVNYAGSAQGTATNKQITWEIFNLDEDFDRIEIAVIIRDSLTGTPVVHIIRDEVINSEPYTFTYTGQEDVVEMTLDDFLSISSAFTHCKTIGTKDNRLFVGNVKNLKRDLDYDARAYRHKGVNQFRLIENGVQNNYTAPTDYVNIDEESDAICPFNLATTDPNYDVNSQFKADASTIGGQGTNISYEFGTVAIKADETIELITGSAHASPYRHTNQNFLLGKIDDLNILEGNNATVQSYPVNSINEDIKFVYYSSLFKGYQHEEIYRFGITFYDKQGNPYFTKWIGDIKFPSVGDACPAGNRIYADGTAQTACTTFDMSFVDTVPSNDVAYVNQMYIKFAVSIPANIRDLVSGYTIDRVERKDEDKRILATGIMTQTFDDGATVFPPDKQATNIPTIAFPYLNIDTVGVNASRGTATMFDSPDFLLKTYPGFVTGDKIKLFRRLTIPAAQTVFDIQPTGAGEVYTIVKYYSCEDLGTETEITLQEASIVEAGAGYSFSGAANTGYIFRNYTDTETGGAGTSDAIGSRTLLLGHSTSINFNATFGCTLANRKKLLAYYIRERSSQYGGNTYSQRSTSSYINCCHFRPIEKGNGTAFTDTFKIFGGDVFSNIYDNQKEIKNWGQTGRAQYVGGSHAGAPNSDKSHTYFFPTTSTFNTELRYGSHVNYNLNNDGGLLASAYESYEYNAVYNCENTIKVNFPKPDPFIEQDNFDNRFYASQIKINGELIDNWGTFLVNNYWDTEGSYGPINSMDILQDKMLFWQDRAFGILSINPRAVIQDTTGTELQLGTGNIIQRHDYIATNIGCKHQWGMCKSPYSYFFFDIINKRFYRYSDNSLNPLSDVKGMQSYFRNNLNGDIQSNDNPVQLYGISATYDREFNEAIFTFKDYDGNNVIKETIAYNEMIDAFTSFYDFKPDFIINDNRVLFSMDSTSNVTKKNIYLHGKGVNYCQFYGTRFDNSIKFLVNEGPLFTKTFDNFEWITEVDVYDPATDSNRNIANETWTETRVYNDYQNTDFQLLDPLSLTPNIKRKERSWRMAIPRNRVLYTSIISPNIFIDISPTRKQFGERIRDKYITVDLTYNNINDYRLVFHENKSIFRISDR